MERSLLGKLPESRTVRVSLVQADRTIFLADLVSHAIPKRLNKTALVLASLSRYKKWGHSLRNIATLLSYTLQTFLEGPCSFLVVPPAIHLASLGSRRASQLLSTALPDVKDTSLMNGWGKA